MAALIRLGKYTRSAFHGVREVGEPRVSVLLPVEPFKKNQVTCRRSLFSGLMEGRQSRSSVGETRVPETTLLLPIEPFKENQGMPTITNLLPPFKENQVGTGHLSRQNPLKKQRKDDQKEEHWKRVAAAAGGYGGGNGDYVGVFEVALHLDDLVFKLGQSEVTKGDVARQIHATTGGLRAYGCWGIKIRLDLPRLYKFWLHGDPKDKRSIPRADYKNHLKVHPTQYIQA